MDTPQKSEEVCSAVLKIIAGRLNGLPEDFKADGYDLLLADCKTPHQDRFLSNIRAQLWSSFSSK